MLFRDESLVHTAERRLEERTQAKLQSIRSEYLRKLESLSVGGSPTLQTMKDHTEREMKNAIRKVQVSYGSHKRQLELLRDGEKMERREDIKGGGRKAEETGGGSALTSDGDTKNKLSYLAELEKDVKSTIQGHCFRLQHMQQANSIKEVLLYLSLRSQGCPRQSAINFASKLHCRIDSTQRKDGPSSMRTIRRLNNQKDGVNVNGWQLHSPKYRLKSEFQLYKMKEDEIDYDSVRVGFERFERGYRIVNGEVQKKDPILDFDHCPSAYSLRPPPTHRRVISLPSLPIPPQAVPSLTIIPAYPQGIPSNRKQPGGEGAKEDDEEKSMIRAAPTMDTSAVVSAQETGNCESRQGVPASLAVLPEIKVKAFHHRVKIVDDAIDSVKAESACVFTFRSLKPDPSAPVLHSLPHTKPRRATVLHPASLSRSPQRRSTCAEFRKRGNSEDKGKISN